MRQKKKQQSQRTTQYVSREQLSAREYLFFGGISFLNRGKEAYSKQYLEVYEELETLYQDDKKLPSKIGLSNEENIKYDGYRLEYINKALDFLLEFYASGKSPFVSHLNMAEQEFAESLKLLNSRGLLEHIAFTIYNLSGELRHKYKSFLKPAPFTWETFEQLGGLMKVAGPDWQSIIAKGIPGETTKRLLNEFNSSEEITEAAISSILGDDIPKLKSLFDYIIGCETRTTAERKKFEPVNLLAIKAFTRRLVDIENLVKLLKLADNQCTNIDHRGIKSTIQKQGKDDQSYIVEVQNNDKRFAREFDLTTKLGRHAALRRLEMIGELITGKNFSSSLKNLDPTIDWQAFIVLRDTIAHQDQGDNKEKVKNLLDDDDLFLAILRDEMQAFFSMLNQIIMRRDENLPKFQRGDISGFWQEVYAHEQKAQAPESQDKQVHSRVPKEEILIFMKALKDANTSQAAVLEWLGVLNGRKEIPNGKDKGELMRGLLPIKTVDEAIFKQCKEIADKAMKKPPTRKKEDILKEQEEARKQRIAEQEKNYKGLEKLRALAKSFSMQNNAAQPLTHQQRVEAAIEALENIKEFMEQDIFVQANFNFQNMREWEKTQNKETVGNFFARLVTNPEFNDAIEYNAAQLLQHLDTIRKFPEAKGECFLDKDYDVLRNLRNYVEHGNYLLEKEEYNPAQKNESILTGRQRVVAPIMITLIFELLPTLKSIKQQIASAQNPITSIENQETPLAAGVDNHNLSSNHGFRPQNWQEKEAHRRAKGKEKVHEI